MRKDCTPFAGKNITILGLGLLGRGVGDAEFLAKCGARVVVTDVKSSDELSASVERLRAYPNIVFHLGGHRMEDFTASVGGPDMVLKAAGVRLDSPEVSAARKAGIPVVMSTALFAKYAMEKGVKIVGVTGTRGKSTVAYMIFHVLTASGRRAHLGGNVRGISTLAMLPIVRAGDIAVLELDSWQLQGFGDMHISPHIALFTNLMPDHRNYYRTEEEYFNDKANIFRYQQKGDALFVGERIERNVRECVARWRIPVDPVVPGELPRDWLLRVPGEHNRDNASFAASALLALGLTAEEIRIGLESFEGIEGRMQLVAEKDGVRIYNDNNATTPEATIAALRALRNGKNIVLIAGGSDKGLAVNALVDEIRRSCKKVVLLAGTGTDRLIPIMRTDSIYQRIDDALRAALQAASPGDTILFSPAFASFGMFKNEYDRNDQFMRLIARL